MSQSTILARFQRLPAEIRSQIFEELVEPPRCHLDSPVPIFSRHNHSHVATSFNITKTAVFFEHLPGNLQLDLALAERRAPFEFSVAICHWGNMWKNHYFFEEIEAATIVAIRRANNRSFNNAHLDLFAGSKLIRIMRLTWMIYQLVFY